MQTTFRSIVGWTATIGACVLVTLFSLNGNGVRASTLECIPEGYDSLGAEQQDVVGKLVERIDKLIGKRPEMAEKIVTVFDTLSADETISETKKEVLLVLRDYYQNVVDGVCESETSESSLWQQLLQGLGMQDQNGGQEREKRGIGRGSGGTAGTGAALCNQGEKPETKRGCKVVPVKNIEKKCIDLTVVCDDSAPIGTGNTGTGSNTGTCAEVPKPEEKTGCILKPLKDRKGCVKDYEYVCKHDKACRDAKAPIARDGCTVAETTDRRGCLSYKQECPDSEDDEDEDEEGDDHDSGGRDDNDR